MPIKLITVRQGDSGPVVYMWVDGTEVGRVELNTRQAMILMRELADKVVME